MLDLQLRAVAFGAAVLVDGAGGAVDLRLCEDLERRVVGVAGGRESGSGENGFEFACAYDRIDLGDVLLDLVAVSLDQATGDDEALGFASVGGLVLDHFEDGVDGLLLGRVDEAAGVDDEDFGVLGVGGDVAASLVEHAHHHFGVDQVLGAAEGDEADFRAGRERGGLNVKDVGRFDCRGRGHRLLF